MSQATGSSDAIIAYVRSAAVLLLMLSCGVSAQPYDAVVAGNDDTCLLITPPLMLSHEIVGGASVPNSRVAAVAPAPSGRVFAARLTFDAFGFEVVELSPDGTITPRTAPLARYPYALVVDAAGETYVLVSGDGPYATAIAAFDGSGALRAVYPVGTDHSALYWYRRTVIDLAADQCTLFVVEDLKRVRRFNVCTGTAMPDFLTASYPEQFTAVRVLPDGGALVAVEWELRRFAPDASLVAKYPTVSDAYALMLTHGGTRVVYGFQQSCAGRLATVDLASGAALSTTELRLELPTSLASYYGWTAALGPAHAAEAPATGAAAIICLAALVMVVALLRLR